jgi:hypothetical protein
MHVQGPGGNTSVKVNDLMAIKASGYEFKNVVDGQGIVLTDFKAIADKLLNLLVTTFLVSCTNITQTLCNRLLVLTRFILTVTLPIPSLILDYRRYI